MCIRDRRRVDLGHAARLHELVRAPVELAGQHAVHALEQHPGRVAPHGVGNERREALAPREAGRARKRDVRVVVGERGHAAGRHARIMFREPARRRRVAMERDPVERVAMQVEHPQLSRRRVAARCRGAFLRADARNLLTHDVVKRQ